jgi:hypothetical protein
MKVNLLLFTAGQTIVNVRGHNFRAWTSPACVTSGFPQNMTLSFHISLHFIPFANDTFFICQTSPEKLFFYLQTQFFDGLMFHAAHGLLGNARESREITEFHFKVIQKKQNV